MKPATARAMADQQIAVWKRDQWMPQEAWAALGCWGGVAVEWREVRDWMVGWLLGQRRSASARTPRYARVPPRMAA